MVIVQERGKILQTHGFYSTTHNMKPVASPFNGHYLRSNREKPPEASAQAIETPIPPALQTMT